MGIVSKITSSAKQAASSVKQNVSQNISEYRRQRAEDNRKRSEIRVKSEQNYWKGYEEEKRKMQVERGRADARKGSGLTRIARSASNVRLNKNLMQSGPYDPFGLLARPQKKKSTAKSSKVVVVIQGASTNRSKRKKKKAKLQNYLDGLM